MQIRLFTIPVFDNGAAQSEMNRFLRSHKIIDVKENFIGKDINAMWCFSISYMENSSGHSNELTKKVDYKTILDEPTFMKFSKLREIRRKAAAEEGLPAFAIFTDEELASLAKLKVITGMEMLTIKGIGEKKVERFGRYFIEESQDNASGG